MKKKLSLLVALTMMLGSMAGLAEEAKQGPTEAELLAKPCEFALIEANGEQPRLTYIEGVTPILEVDGYKFKDMNKNGKLDPYEDWRLDTETRVNDLISQMTPEEEAGLLFCVSANLETARSLIPDFNLTCMLFNLNGTPDNVVSTLNNLQAAAEKERLGVPMISPLTVSSTLGAATSTRRTSPTAPPMTPNWRTSSPTSTARRWSRLVSM